MNDVYKLNEDDRKEVIDRYTSRLDEYGVSPKALGWDKGKQDLRYYSLLKNFNLEGKVILDIGSGFGDANKYIANETNNYSYIGVELVPSLLEEAKKVWEGHDNIRFVGGDFLTLDIEKVDIVVASGVFNFKLNDSKNYEFIADMMRKAFSICREGVAFDFLSNKVDFEYEHTFHSDPAVIINHGYELTRNLLLDNTYMPFEFCVVMCKDNGFDIEDTIFKRFKHERSYHRFY